MSLFLLPKDQIMALAERSKDLCVSIFMPTQHAGPPVRQNLIRFKNLLQEAEERLVESGVRPQDAKEILEPAQALDNEDFWRHQSDGIAFFLAPGLFRYYRLPLSFNELVVVTDRFHLKPLLPLFSGDGQFYLLALSQQDVRLLQGTRYSVSEIDLQNVPQSLAEALRYDDTGKPTQFGAVHPEGEPPTLLYKQVLSTVREVPKRMMRMHLSWNTFIRLITDYMSYWAISKPRLF